MPGKRPYVETLDANAVQGVVGPSFGVGKSGGGGTPVLSISILGDETKTCFTDVPVRFQVFILISETGSLAHVSTQLKVSIVEENSAKVIEAVRPGEGGLVELESPVDGCIKNGQGVFSVTVREGAFPWATQVKFHFLACDGHLPTAMSGFSPVLTIRKAAISFVKTSGRALEPLWYKDEGGKQNTLDMSVVVKCISTGEPCADVRLTALLVYENMVPVSNQDIMRLIDGTSLETNAAGVAVVKTRITEVSHRHQGQRFRILISPDIRRAPMTADIAPAASEPILVLSKRKTKVTKSGTEGRPDSSFSLMRRDSPAHSMSRQSSAASTGWSSEPLSSATNGGEMDAALESWLGEAVRLVNELQWQRMGFEADEGGRPDMRRPIFRCPICKRGREEEPYAATAGLSSNRLPHRANSLIQQSSHGQSQSTLTASGLHEPGCSVGTVLESYAARNGSIVQEGNSHGAPLQQQGMPPPLLNPPTSTPSNSLHGLYAASRKMCFSTPSSTSTPGVALGKSAYTQDGKLLGFLREVNRSDRIADCELVRVADVPECTPSLRAQLEAAYAQDDSLVIVGAGIGGSLVASMALWE